MCERTVTISLNEDEQRAWDECPKGTRVRFSVKEGRMVWGPGPRSGEGVVALIWNCMGEPCWDVTVTPTYEEAVYGGNPEDVRVGIFPGFGDLIEPVDRGSYPESQL